ncbi:DUF2092 domain-containing protein [Flavobacterium sp.]|uniref:DUF2092 domain-containing protein n=1 Tax=Flavobacterium sp. TaxID=239 RepID=UPI003A90134E
MINKYLLLALFIPFVMFAQNTKVDSIAVLVTDRMSDVIGDLTSCSFKMEASMDETGQYELEKRFTSYQVYLKGPNRLLVQARGDKSHKGYWYNGEHLVYYSYRENNYSVIAAPDSTLTAIEKIHNDYGIEFPAADFFFPAITDDILENFPVFVYLGSKYINGKECFHLMADNDKMNFQVWVSNDAYTLPMKFSITYKDREGTPQYNATFSEWSLNPDLPDVLFDFIPPPDAGQIAILPMQDE